MAQLDVRRLYEDGKELLKNELDAFVDDIEVFVNLTQLNDDNLQDASITASSKFVDGTVTNAKFVSSTLEAAKFASDSITTGKLADGIVGTTQLASSSVDSTKIATGAITAAKILDGNITDIKIKNTQVTTAFTAAGDANLFSSASAKASCTITTTSTRPVLISIVGGSTRKLRQDSVGTSASGLIFFIAVTRTTSGTTTFWKLGNWAVASNSNLIEFKKAHCPSFCFIDDSPGIGTHTYSLYYGENHSGGADFSGSGTLLAMEL